MGQLSAATAVSDITLCMRCTQQSGNQPNEMRFSPAQGNVEAEEREARKKAEKEAKEAAKREKAEREAKEAEAAAQLAERTAALKVRFLQVAISACIGLTVLSVCRWVAAGAAVQRTLQFGMG